MLASRDQDFFFFLLLSSCVIVIPTLSVPQFSVYKLEMAFATNLPPGISQGFMSWLPSLEPAERCPSLRGSSNSRETGKKGRWVLSI